MKAYNKKAGFQNFSQSAAGEVRKKLLKKYRFEKALGLTVESKTIFQRVQKCMCEHMYLYVYTYVWMCILVCWYFLALICAGKLGKNWK